MKEAVKSGGILFDNTRTHLYKFTVPVHHGQFPTNFDDALFCLDAGEAEDRIAQHRAADVQSPSNAPSRGWWILEVLPMLVRTPGKGRVRPRFVYRRCLILLVIGIMPHKGPNTWVFVCFLSINFGHPRMIPQPQSPNHPGPLFHLSVQERMKLGVVCGARTMRPQKYAPLARLPPGVVPEYVE